MIDFNILSFYLAEAVSVFVVALLFFPDASPSPQKLSASSILGVSLISKDFSLVLYRISLRFLGKFFSGRKTSFSFQISWFFGL